MNSKTSPILLAVTLFAVLLLTGCQPPRPAALSDAQLGQVTENILKAINAGIYQNFVMDFSDPMKAAFPESEFTKLHDLLQNASGIYVSHSAPPLLNNQGFAEDVLYPHPRIQRAERVLKHRLDRASVPLELGFRESRNIFPLEQN